MRDPWQGAGRHSGRNDHNVPAAMLAVHALVGGGLVAILGASAGMPPGAAFALLAMVLLITVPGLPASAAAAVSMLDALAVSSSAGMLVPGAEPGAHGIGTAAVLVLAFGGFGWAATRLGTWTSALRHLVSHLPRWRLR